MTLLDRPAQIHYNPGTSGPLAQWLEQATHNRLVAGSNPAGATKFNDVNHAVKPPFYRWLFCSFFDCPLFVPPTFSFMKIFIISLYMKLRELSFTGSIITICSIMSYVARWPDLDRTDPQRLSDDAFAFWPAFT